MDNSSNIIEDIKWFLYGAEDVEKNIKNEHGFQHYTNFVTWVGDGHSFIITDGTDEYRITISKKEL